MSKLCKTTFIFTITKHHYKYISQNSCKRYYNTFKAKFFYYKLIYILWKAVMQRLSPTGAANYVFWIDDQWKIQAQKAAINFSTTSTSEY